MRSALEITGEALSLAQDLAESYDWLGTGSNLASADKAERKCLKKIQTLRADLAALSGADDASNASAEARLLTGSLAKDVAAAAKRVSEWSAAKQDYARRAIGAVADEGKKSESAIAGPLNLDSEMLRRDALLDRPSDPTPAEQREAIAQWPDGCRNPNSCSIHRDCMYLQCKHYERDISGEVDAALSTRALSERKDRE
jgi:hypothetical protein